MKFDIFCALRILSAEFGVGRSSIEVEDGAGQLVFTVRVIYHGIAHSSEFIVRKEEAIDSFTCVFNNRFRLSILHIKDLAGLTTKTLSNPGIEVFT